MFGLTQGEKIQFSGTLAHEDAEVWKVLQIDDNLTPQSKYDTWKKASTMKSPFHELLPLYFVSDDGGKVSLKIIISLQR